MASPSQIPHRPTDTTCVCDSCWNEHCERAKVTASPQYTSSAERRTAECFGSWLREQPRRPAAIAFTDGLLRYIAYEVEAYERDKN